MIRSESVDFSIGEFRLENANLEVADGEYFVLLGPPGSGKSVLLECLCGLNRVQSGRVFVDGQDVTDAEPRRRCIGYVPQDYALFPHLSVERNIQSGLRARHESRGQIHKRTMAVADLLGIGHLLKRGIVGLSGGEKQRTALARALAIEPRVLLLDEPVSALDESTRERICGELRQLQRELRITTIHISHNLEEAFSVADRGGILFNGRFQQIGPLGDLLRRPANEFAARFMRCQNILTGRSLGPGPDGATKVAVGEAEFLVPGRHEGQVQFIVRAENLRVMRADRVRSDQDGVVLAVEVVRSTDLGAYVRLYLNGPVTLVAHLSHLVYTELRPCGQTGLVAIVPPEAVHVLSADPAEASALPSNPERNHG
ncbi:MAG: ATP-binding cassette domain-containing protein [Planctomycetes bacterium]|nr:ATP-binding cassette domain-containing protein [Planctomycetota bacterium]